MNITMEKKDKRKKIKIVRLHNKSLTTEAIVC